MKKKVQFVAKTALFVYVLRTFSVAAQRLGSLFYSFAFGIEEFVATLNDELAVADEFSAVHFVSKNIRYVCRFSLCEIARLSCFVRSSIGHIHMICVIYRSILADQFRTAAEHINGISECGCRAPIIFAINGGQGRAILEH